MVALQTQGLVQAKTGQRLPGIVVGHLGIGVVGADLVQYEKREELQAGAGREGKPSLDNHDGYHCKDHQQLFDPPGQPVHGCPAECQGKGDQDQQQDQL